MSDSAITTINAELAPVTGWNAQQIELIKTQVAPGCTDLELSLFQQVCARTGLDPFSRQIYAIRRKDRNAPGGEKMTIQVSIDGFRLIASRSGKYGASESLWCGADGEWHDVWLSPQAPAAAKTLVWRTGSDRPFTAVARWDSYAQMYNGQPTHMWKKMPDVLLAKCSEALALRKAFPAELSGLYSTEEMAQADSQVAEVTSAPVRKASHRDPWETYLNMLKRVGNEEQLHQAKAWALDKMPDRAEDINESADSVWRQFTAESELAR